MEFMSEGGEGDGVAMDMTPAISLSGGTVLVGPGSGAEGGAFWRRIPRWNRGDGQAKTCRKNWWKRATHRRGSKGGGVGRQNFSSVKVIFPAVHFPGLPRVSFLRVTGRIWGVKICVQHQGTRKFLRGVDSWVDSMESARLFPNPMEALRHCVNNPIGQVNIIIDRGLERPPIIIAVEGAQVPIQLAPGPLRAAA